MPQPGWSAKRARQYEHIERCLEERGRSKKVAKQIAARTVNKERARAGEARQASKTSTDDISSSRRGGLRSHSGSGGRTRDQLYADAKAKNIAGRSTMNTAQLERPSAAHRLRQTALVYSALHLSAPQFARLWGAERCKAGPG